MASLFWQECFACIMCSITLFFDAPSHFGCDLCMFVHMKVQMMIGYALKLASFFEGESSFFVPMLMGFEFMKMPAVWNLFIRETNGN